MYIKVSGSEITYPYTLDNLRNDNTNVSFPKNLTNDILASFHTYPIIYVDVDIDSDYEKNYVEGTPIQSGSVYVQNWITSSASVEEIAQRKEEKWTEIREIRNNLLSECDWTQMNDTPISGSKLTEWQTYRQSLRDITSQSNPFEITWSTKPE
jgi:hypothetical protein